VNIIREYGYNWEHSYRSNPFNISDDGPKGKFVKKGIRAEFVGQAQEDENLNYLLGDLNLAELSTG